MATINASANTVAAVQTAVNSATAGDTVVIPSGTATWSTTLSLNKAITLTGSGTLATTINTASGGPSWGTGVITISAAATLSNIAFGNANTASTCIDTRTTNGWRITGCSYTNTTSNGANTGYFIYANSYGLIDHCTANSTLNGSSEMIFIVGPTNSWQTADTMGTANAVYIEDCTFDDAGYVCDAHANSRAVARFNTINGSNKIDCHGLQSASPRGARHIEVYNNTFTYGGYVMFIELRSGTGRAFNNTATYDTNWLSLVEYYVAQGGQTSAGYPFDDQVGVGIDPKSGGSAPFYMWGNRHGSNVKWLNERNPGGADMTGTINPERDYFEELSGTFTGSAGVGIGTKAQMNAITPTTTGVGFWVTNESSWNTTVAAGTSGQLYRWNGSAWVLYYTPYTYPHPLNDGGAADTTPATLSSATVPIAGTSITLAFDEAVTRNAATPTLSASGGAVTLTYSSGSGSASHVYTTSRTIQSGETITLSATLSAGNWTDASGNSTTTISGFSVTNNSTQGESSPVTFTAMNVTTLQFA